MEENYQLIVLKHSITINGLYFRISEIRSVEVIEQETPIFRRLLGINIGANIILALIFAAFEIAAVVVVLCLIVAIEAVIIYANKKKYALRIVQNLGSTKAIIATDKATLEQIRLKIADAVAYARTDEEQDA